MWFHLYEILERTVESLASESKVSRRGSGTEGQEGGFAKQREETLGAAAPVISVLLVASRALGRAWKETEASTPRNRAGDPAAPRQRAA